jgi:hypothetical protein
VLETVSWIRQAQYAGIAIAGFSRMARTAQHQDDRKRRDERGYTPDGGGGHASGGGKRSHSDEKKQTTGKPSPRRGPMKADR